MEEKKTCRTCIACASKLLISEPVGCVPSSLPAVYRESIACGKYTKHVPPFQHCSNCKSSMKGNGDNGHYCKKRVCFPSEKQFTTYISCEKFVPKPAVLKEAYLYWMARSMMVEAMIVG